MEDDFLPKQHPVHAFFSYNHSDGKSTCVLSGCLTEKIIGRHTGNSTRHIKRQHKDAFPLLEKNIEEFYSEKKSKRVKKKNGECVNVLMNHNDIVKACVELVTVNGRPLRMLEDSGFKRILDPIVESFAKTSSPLILNEEFIKSEIENHVQNVQSKIATVLQGKLLSLKIDTTKCLGRNFLGINVQYFHNQKLFVRTLAVKRIKEDATAQNLAYLIRDALPIYGFDVDQIYSITSDNGTPVVACVNIVKVFQDHVLDDFLGVQLTEESQQDFQRQLDVELERIERGEATHFLFGIRCVAHTTELALEDAFKKCNLSGLISSYRELVKKLRSCHIISLLEERKLPKPILDGETRFITSTFNMVNKK